MWLKMLKGKIHRARITGTHLDYVGSITIDADLLEAAGILPGEAVQVLNVMNGARIETYTIEGERGSGVVALNGPAARWAEVGDVVIVIAYAYLTPDEAQAHEPRVVFVDEKNRIVALTGQERM